MKGKLSHVFCFSAILISGVGSLWGQADTSIRGTITDQSGAAVPKAQLTLTRTSTGTARTGVSSAVGEYEFQQVTPGSYTLSVEAPGFKKYDASNLQLQVNSPATLNIVLQVGGTNQTVAVTAETPLLNTTDASIGSVMTENQVKELPIEGRDVAALYSLQPGVVYLGNNPNIDQNTDTRSGAVNGARSDQSNLLLDGVDANDQTRGYAFTTVLRMTPDSIQEFRVATTNYDAESGRSSGAEVSIVTKGGTNSFHGSVYEYNRNTATEANDYFLKLAQDQSGQPNKPLQFIRNVYGASLGGPIKKDRAFFFMNYEGRRDAQQQSAVRVVPSLTLRQGTMVYPNVNGGITTLTAAQLTAMDPLGIGPNPTILKYFQSFPAPNDTTVGDGFNYDGYRFAAPIHNEFNTYIARFDYMLTADGKHNLFWRGNLMDDQEQNQPYLPGENPVSSIDTHSRGFVIGETDILTPTMVSNFRYGFTRQSVGTLGNADLPQIILRGLNDNTVRPYAYGSTFQTPVHNIVDDVSWKKGNHAITFGTNIRFIRNPETSLTSSFSDGSTNASWLPFSGIANTGAPGQAPGPTNYMDPQVYGYPAVASTFNNGYDYPLMALMGAVTEGDAEYNYDKNGTLLPQGTPIKRNFALDEYEFYAQDSYRLKPNFTVTYGLRYELMSPPWEVNGLEVAPNVNISQWFQQRGIHGAEGIPSNADPTVSFNLAGSANGKPGVYPWQTKNFAPRVGIAWAPHGGPSFLGSLLGRDKTSIRAGFGVAYDNFGEGLISTFDQNGAYGLSSLVVSPPAALDLSTAPRLTSLNEVPPAVMLPAPPGGFPQTPPPSAGSIVWGLDNGLKTPYSYQLDFSISRELPKDMIFEAAYVGHLAHRLLTQEDVALPLNLVDTATGVDYFTAATRFSQLAEAGVPASAITPGLVGKTAGYWGDIFPNLPTLGGFPGMTPLQAAYSVMSSQLHNETTGLFLLDFPGNVCPNGCSKFGPNAFYNSQYSSLYAWRTIGNSSYNGLQLSLRKRFSQGVQFDFYYTFSKSLDISSDAERIGAWGGLGGQVINSWDYKALRGPSDFDTTHQVTANWVAELPFGHNKYIARNANNWVNAIIGGWQLTGVWRWTSGFPVSVSNGATWPTNWQIGGLAMPAGTTLPTSGSYQFGDGTVSLFPNGTAAASYFRNDYPGESGTRNNLRGDGVFNIDMGLDKRWRMPYNENHSLQFRWEVFNVTNSVRFNVQSVSLALDQQPTFGNYTQELSLPRVMQFALRYEF